MIDLEEWLRLEDVKFLASLKQCRLEADLTVEDVATAMGRSVTIVEEVERPDGNPRLSTLRRYAATIGAVIQHRVTHAAVDVDEPEEGEPEEGGDG